MKTQALLASITLALAGSAFAAGDKHDHKPLHGGVVVEVKDMDYELVAKPTVIQLHLRDHGKAADLSKATAKLTLLTGTEKQEVELKPAGDKLEATGSFKVGPGTKAVAIVTVAGKPSTARFTLK
ncbi:hypothetical protein [Methylibium petroleiphilum]|jgi:hypothetical protein|uniref:hypothetical protein n=1 Tax=Methylibium petroleiphilum TaxID=105560 RepID=UPI001AC7BDBA|nr:hypothetical protein [Methylibium petroleiphilum]MBN9203730.1 hypothetical protein [Methylibium petroleiphilum]MBX3603020.1 hypothetical protein [Rubrivivax sp.]